MSILLKAKFVKFNEVKLVHFSNMCPVLFTDEILKLVISIVSKDLQPENIYSIDFTLEVSKYFIFKFLSFVFPLNI